MGEKILFDITDSEKALESLSEMLGIGESDIYLFLYKNVTTYLDTQKLHYDLIEKFNIDYERIDLEKVEIKAIHVTSGNDDGKSIHDNGLLNLREAIRKDTPMRNFLNSRGIEIDIDKMIIKYKGEERKIEDNTNKCWEERDLVYHKLEKDYLINGFHCDNNPIGYSGNVAYRPEFIGSIGKFIRNENLQYDWAKEFNQCYIVEFKAVPYKYEWFNYQIDNMSKDDYEMDRSYHIKRWLVRQSINVICHKILAWEKPEIFSYLGFDENIPKEDILKITNVTSERDKR